MTTTGSEPVEEEGAPAEGRARIDAAQFEGSEGLSTQPAEVALPSLNVPEMLRWTWRQLTSMRIALLLLFLLSLAAIPGSLIPQRSTDPIKVSDFYHNHPSLAPILDDLQLFDVFKSSWFIAIYLLLFISLLGCIVPRSYQHYRQMRAKPPATPRRLSALPTYRRYVSETGSAEALDAAGQVLRRRRFRTRRREDSVGAEKGYLRETGNLLFHLALLALLLAVGLGAATGYSGSVLITEGSGYADTLTQFDNFSAGPLFDDSSLPPYTITLNHFDASYQTTGTQMGAARSFDAHVTVRDTPTSAPRQVDLQENHPLSFGSTQVFLQGHGYSPIFTVKDGRGQVVYDGPTPFLPQDTNFDSTGVVKVPDARPEQLGFSGLFLPTAYVDSSGFRSVFPAAQNPEVILLAYAGNLGLDNGATQNVYLLDTSQLTKLQVDGKPDTQALLPGQTMALPNGLGSITFDGYKQWVNLQIHSNPGTPYVLGAAITAVVGLLLSLRVRRRRVWVRVAAADDGRTVVEVAGLARTETGELDQEVERITGALLERVPAAEPEARAGGSPGPGASAAGGDAEDAALAADRTR